tara:strand:+ start:589 stop:1794 length:1206 start_codon:yes stop_codon:yes gene_type:complete
MFKYNYKTIADKDISALYSDNNNSIKESLNLTVKKYKYNDSDYGIIKYNKESLSDENVDTVGLFRSVIYKNKKIMAIAPPKSASYNKFMTQHDINECVVEEYVEGTMVNMFYDNDSEEWEIATRSTVGGKTNFIVSSFNNHTFRSMFLEASNNANFEYDILDKTLCYSFVLQHPKNRIVVPFSQTRIYLTACYRINDDFTVDVIDVDSIKETLCSTNIQFPKKYTGIEEVYNLTELMSDSFGDYTVVGFMIHHHNSGMRCKIRNEGTYEYVRKLRGNQPKEQYRYLELCHTGRLDVYLSYYPEDIEAFNNYRNQVNSFINTLYQNYVKCFIKKECPLVNYPYQYKTHMYELHKIYLEKIKPGKVQYTTVMNINIITWYILNLPPAKLMYAINYHHRPEHLG